MPSIGYSLRAHAIESLTRVKRPGVPWRVVVRNTAAVVLPLARKLLSNGNRLARTAMTMEAMLDDFSGLRVQAEFNGFVAQSAGAVQTISTALRSRQPTPTLPDLRALQRALVSQMSGLPPASTIALLARITDGLVDNVATLATS